VVQEVEEDLFRPVAVEGEVVVEEEACWVTGGSAVLGLEAGNGLTVV
jgi:hypothetical protein